VVESHHARVFAPVTLNRIRESTFNNLEIMKPTPQISREQQAARSSPLTDYNFQPVEIAGDTPATTVKTAAVFAGTKSLAFHKLSSEVFGAKTTREYFAELFVFVVNTGIVAWPIISALVAVTRMVRNY
jgi:hypothetical protein